MKTYEIRPDAIDADVAVTLYTEVLSEPKLKLVDDDALVPATKTPQFNPFLSFLLNPVSSSAK